MAQRYQTVTVCVQLKIPVGPQDAMNPEDPLDRAQALVPLVQTRLEAVGGATVTYAGLEHPRARDLHELLREFSTVARSVVQELPYSRAVGLIQRLDGFADEFGAELGLGEYVGQCETCEEPLFDGDDYESDEVTICRTCIIKANTPLLPEIQG